MHLVGTRKYRNKIFAWIFPPRTGTRYTKDLISKHGWFSGNCGHHQIIPDRLEDGHWLLCNVRNPYTRVQSWWKRLAQTNNISLEEYIQMLQSIDKTNPIKSKVEPVIFMHKKSPISYLQPITDMVKFGGIDIKRINQLIRMEFFEEDLRSVGLMSDVPVNRYASKHGGEIQLEWFYDKPTCIEIINNIYHDDFKNFNYKMLPT